MNSVAIAAIAFVAFLSGAISIYLFMRDRYEMLTRLNKIDADLAEEKRRREAIEGVNGLKSHYTWNIHAAGLDIAANIKACEFELIELEGRLQTMLKQAHAIIKDPSKYDPEKPGKEQ